MRKVASIQHEGGFTAICGFICYDKIAYVLATKNGEGKKPCMIYKIRLKDGKQMESILIADGKNIAVHANSITYYGGLFYIVTRNGAGKNYNQVLAVDKTGKIKKKYKYDHAKSKIATIAYDFAGKWYITVNGGEKVKCREVELKDGWIRDKREIILHYPTDDIGNDIFATYNEIYGSKVYESMLGGYVAGFDKNGKWIEGDRIELPKGYTKFEIEGYCSWVNEYIVVNGVKNGKQADGIWEV